MMNKEEEKIINRREYKRDYYLKNKERLSKLGRLRYKKDKDKILAENKVYRDNNKEKADKRRAEYYEKNKKRLDAWKKQWIEENKEKIKKQKAEWYIKNTKKNKCIICGKTAKTKYCSIKCMGIGKSGANNIFWLGGKSYEEYSKEWTNTFKRTIRERDGNMCMICNRHRDEFDMAMDVHHIDGDKQNTTVENCISLCHGHHMIVEKTGDKKYTFWMPHFQKMLSKIHGYDYSHLIIEKEVIKV